MSQIAPETTELLTGEQLIEYYTDAAAVHSYFKFSLINKDTADTALNKVFLRADITDGASISSRPIMAAKLGRLYLESRLAAEAAAAAESLERKAAQAVREITDTLHGRIAHVTTIGGSGVIMDMRHDGFSLSAEAYMSTATGRIRESEYPNLDLDWTRKRFGFMSRDGLMRVPILGEDHQPQVEIVIE